MNDNLATLGKDLFLMGGFSVVKILPKSFGFEISGDNLFMKNFLEKSDESFYGKPNLAMPRSLYKMNHNENSFLVKEYSHGPMLWPSCSTGRKVTGNNESQDLELVNGIHEEFGAMESDSHVHGTRPLKVQ